MIQTIVTPPHTPIESPASDAFDPGAFASIPLTALSRETHMQLSRLLNMKKILRSEDGYERDYRGIGKLAELGGFFDEQNSNIEKVLQEWCSKQPKTATFGKLEEFLGKIDRWDVSDDIHENLVKDANKYVQTQNQNCNNSENTQQTNGHVNEQSDDTDISGDPEILTKDDVQRAKENLPPQQYDAFVLCASEDLEYATQMIVLENNYKLKLCFKERDVLGGLPFTHVVLPKLIDERCKYLIAILTDQFFQSPENKFLINYTQAHQIEENRRKVIPVRFGNVVIPRTLSILTTLTYQQSSPFFDFWDRLAESIRQGSRPIQQINGKITPTLADPPTSRDYKQRSPTKSTDRIILNTNTITKTATQQRLLRSNATQINLNQMQQTQQNSPTSPNTPLTPKSITQTTSPTISDIPSISINGQIVEDYEDSKPTSPLEKIRNGLGMRRSVTIGAQMSNSSIDLTSYKEQQKRQYATVGKKSIFYIDAPAEGEKKYKKRLALPGFGKKGKIRQSLSTSQLNTEVNMNERTTSYSDVSMNSGVSEPKKKKKWSHKLKSIFSRSSNKLAETA